MSCVIEMEPLLVKRDGPITLANLPPDIIRRVVQMEKHSNMRLISPDWDAQVHIDFRVGPVERVYIGAGIPQDNRRIGDETGEEADKRINKEMERVSMYAIVPVRWWEADSKKWLRLHGMSDDAAEVACDPEWIVGEMNMRRYAAIIASVILLCLSILCALFFSFHYTIKLGIIIFVILLIASLITTTYTFTQKPRLIGVQEQQAREKFTKFYAEFSHIGTLVIENFIAQKRDKKMHRDKKIDRAHVLDAVLETLKGVKIRRLEVSEFCVDEIYQDRIVKLCRKNHVRQVFIEANHFPVNIFSNFATELCELGVILDIYERFHSLHHSEEYDYFGKPWRFWSRTDKELHKKGISLRYQNFGPSEYDYSDHRAQSHIRVEKSTEYITRRLRPVERSRGFIQEDLEES